MKALNERVPFTEIKEGDYFAVGRGRNQKFYLKVGRCDYVQVWHATEGIKTFRDRHRLVYKAVADK